MTNTLIHWDCFNALKSFPNSCIDLTVTSPPYDNLRTYNGYSWDFEWIAKELYRVTKDWWVVVWIIWDQTIKWSETWTSFKQALYFKEIGFNLHDTMIYKKINFAPYDPKCNRYYQEFEYMFVFSKWKVDKCNYIREECKHFWWRAWAYWRKQNWELRLDRKETNKTRRISETKIKANIWDYSNVNKTGHPAPFPEKLAEDHILSWSNPWDLILDPFAWSWTTLKMAKKNWRNYVWIEISEEYIEIIKKRLWL